MSNLVSTDDLLWMGGGAVVGAGVGYAAKGKTGALLGAAVGAMAGLVGKQVYGLVMAVPNALGQAGKDITGALSSAGQAVYHFQNPVIPAVKLPDTAPPAERATVKALQSVPWVGTTYAQEFEAVTHAYVVPYTIGKWAGTTAGVTGAKALTLPAKLEAPIVKGAVLPGVGVVVNEWASIAKALHL